MVYDHTGQKFSPTKKNQRRSAFVENKGIVTQHLPVEEKQTLFEEMLVLKVLPFGRLIKLRIAWERFNVDPSVFTKNMYQSKSIRRKIVLWVERGTLIQLVVTTPS